MTEEQTITQTTAESTPVDTEPWYETQCPNAQYVRKHQLSRITKHYNIENGDKFPFHHRILKNTLEVFLPDDGMNNFGSYRGYSTFGLDLDLEKQIINAYVEHMYLYERSMRVLQTEFTPYLLHYLYKPNGIRFMGLSHHFNTVVAGAASAASSTAPSPPLIATTLHNPPTPPTPAPSLSPSPPPAPSLSPSPPPSHHPSS